MLRLFEKLLDFGGNRNKYISSVTREQQRQSGEAKFGYRLEPSPHSHSVSKYFHPARLHIVQEYINKATASVLMH